MSGDAAMLFRRGLSPLSFAVGFISGILFTVVFMVGRICDYTQSSAGDIGGRSFVLRAADGLEDVAVHLTATPEVEKSVEKQLKSDRKDTVTQSAVNFSVNQINDKIAGCELVQKDSTWVARQLHRQVRVLCWVMTSPSSLDTRARYIRDTWGKRCNILLFASDYKNDSFPTINITVPHGREHLTMKTRKAFDYVYAQHRDDADWFLKTDDDTYVIMENLRHMLAPHNPLEALSFGHNLLGPGYSFFSGGAGYVISREALNRWARRPPGVCIDDGPGEDVMMGKCLGTLGVKAGDSRDSLGRHRFNVFRLTNHLRGVCPVWYYRHSKYHDIQGPNSVSDYPVSFHYVTSHRMLELEYFVYRIHAYGVVGGLQSVNPTLPLPSKSTKTILSPSSELKQKEGVEH